MSTRFLISDFSTEIETKTRQLRETSHVCALRDTLRKLKRSPAPTENDKKRKSGQRQAEALVTSQDLLWVLCHRSKMVALHSGRPEWSSIRRILSP